MTASFSDSLLVISDFPADLQSQAAPRPCPTKYSRSTSRVPLPGHALAQRNFDLGHAIPDLGAFPCGGTQRVRVQEQRRTPSYRGHQFDDVAPGLAHVPFDQSTGIEVTDQNRSSRSSLTAAEKRWPLPRIGLAIGGNGFA